MDKRLMLGPRFTSAQKIYKLDLRGRSAGSQVAFVQDKDAPIVVATKRPPFAVFTLVDLTAVISHKGTESNDARLAFVPRDWSGPLVNAHSESGRRIEFACGGT